MNPEEDSYYDLPGSVRGARQPLRPLRARDPEGPAVRRPRPAAHRLRRLERRHEPGRRGRARRERLAGVLPLRRADAVRRPGPAARRRRLRGSLPVGGGRAAAAPRGGGVGRVVVPARLLRRRVAARLVEQPRVPDRLDCAELVRPLRGRGPGARPRRDGRRGRAAGSPGRRRSSACSTRRSTPPRSTPGTSRATSRACGRTADSTRTPPSGRRWPSPNSATPGARGTCGG